MTNRRRVPRALLAAVMVSLSLAAPSGAQTADTPEFVMQPAKGSATEPGGSYFLLETKPGSRLEQALVIRNDAKRPATILLAGVDAGTGPFGGIGYDLPEEKAERVGAWIEVGTKSISLQPAETKKIPFTVTVPKDAEPGQHLGGISAIKKGGARESGEGQVGVLVQTRQVITVFVQLPGPIEPELVIDGVEPEARPDGFYLLTKLTNKGTGFAKGTGTLRVPDDGFEKKLELGEFVPHTSTAYPIKWKSAAPRGEHCATVEINYKGKDVEKTASWEGCFELGQELLDELEDRSGDEAPPSFLEKWSNLIIAAMIALVLIALMLLLRQRSRKKDGSEDPVVTPDATECPPE